MWVYSHFPDFDIVLFDLEYPEAKELYTNAIKICPNDFAKEKSIFHANRAACLVKMV